MSQAHTTRNTLTPAALAALEAGDTAALIDSHRPLFGGWTMEADPGTDPAADPAGTDPPADPAADPAGGDPDADPAPEDETEDERVRRANRQAANYRTQLREAQQQLQQVQEAQSANAGVLDALRKALTGESDADPEADPAEQLAGITGERDTLRGRVSELEAELLVHNLAGTNGANPTALLDSRDFTRTLHGLDASADDYSDQVSQAIADAVAKNDRYAAQGQGPSRGGADGAGSGSQTPGGVTQDQFNAMSYGERTELFRTNPALYRRLNGTA